MIGFYIYNVINQLIWLYSILIVIDAILSWVPALAQSIVGVWIDKVVNPYLGLFRIGPFKKLMYSTGIDLSPVIALFVLYIAQSLIQEIAIRIL